MKTWQAVDFNGLETQGSEDFASISFVWIKTLVSEDFAASFFVGMFKSIKTLPAVPLRVCTGESRRPAVPLRVCTGESRLPAVPCG